MTDSQPTAIQRHAVPPAPSGPVDIPIQLPDSKEPPKPNGWTPDGIEALATNVLPYVDRYLKLQENEQKHEAAIAESESRWNNRTTLLLLGFTLVIIGTMSWLTYVGKVSGDALLFLVGYATDRRGRAQRSRTRSRAREGCACGLTTPRSDARCGAR